MILRKGIIGLGGGGSGGGGGHGLWVIAATKVGGTFLTSTSTSSVGGSAQSINSLSTDAPKVKLTIIGDRGTAFEPLVTVNGVRANRASGNTNAARTTGTFQWTITVPTAAIMVIKSSDGSKYNLSVAMDTPAVVSNLEIVNNPVSGDFYPTGQTEVKSGDAIFVSFTTDKAVKSVMGVNTGAGRVHTTALTVGTTHTNVRLICGSTTTSAQLKNISINTETDAGAKSNTPAVSSNQINCNNLHPTVQVTSVVYPTNQTAIKDSEQATVNMNTANFDSIAYSTPLNQITIPDMTTDTATKVVTRVGSSYNVSQSNFSVTANRIANGSSTSTNRVIRIAHVAPLIRISSPSPMISGGNDGTSMGNYTVTINSSQRIQIAPTLVAPHGTLGTFSHSDTATVFTASMGVSDNDSKGLHLWGDVLVTGLAGLTTTVFTDSSSYTFSGIKTRTFTVPAFGSTVTVHATIDNPQALTAHWDFTGALTYSATDALTPDGFAVINVTATTFDIKLLDAPKVAASSQSSTLRIN